MTHRTIFEFSLCCSLSTYSHLVAVTRSTSRDVIQTKSLLIPLPPHQPRSLLACALCFCFALPCLAFLFAPAPANHDRRQPSVSLRSGGFPQTDSSAAPHHLCESFRSRKPRLRSPSSCLLPLVNPPRGFRWLQVEITSCGTPPSAI